jgi:hypothetical protein
LIVKKLSLFFPSSSKSSALFSCYDFERDDHQSGGDYRQRPEQGNRLNETSMAKMPTKFKTTAGMNA